jgi:hypothetical protein
VRSDWTWYQARSKNTQFGNTITLLETFILACPMLDILTFSESQSVCLGVAESQVSYFPFPEMSSRGRSPLFHFPQTALVQTTTVALYERQTLAESTSKVAPSMNHQLAWTRVNLEVIAKCAWLQLIILKILTALFWNRNNQTRKKRRGGTW